MAEAPGCPLEPPEVRHGVPLGAEELPAQVGVDTVHLTAQSAVVLGGLRPDETAASRHQHPFHGSQADGCLT